MFHRFGPYHHARLQAAGQRGMVVAIELSATDCTYGWDYVDGANGFRRLTVFEDLNRKIVSIGEVNRRVRQALQEAAPHVVALHGWSEPDALMALSWCLEQRVPAIVMSESQTLDIPRKWWRESIKRRVVKLFSAGFVGGTRHREYLVQLGMERGQLATGYDVVDNIHFERGAHVARNQSDYLRQTMRLPKHFFLASSRFVPEKNLLRLFQAYVGYRQLGAPGNWKLVLLGDGELKPEILHFRKDYALEEHLVLPGFEQYLELPKYYGLAETFVHASIKEPWGLVVNEAMAAGLPVLVSNRCGCAPDLVKEGHNGYTFDPYDVGTMTKHLLKMAGGEYDRAAMGMFSRENIHHWSPESFAENLWKIAQVALDAPRPSFNRLDLALLHILMHK